MDGTAAKGASVVTMDEVLAALNDLDRRLTALKSHGELTEAQRRAEYDAMARDLERLRASQAELRKEHNDFEDEVEQKYVTKERFTPFEKIVGGAVAAILLMVLTAAVALVVRTG